MALRNRLDTLRQQAGAAAPAPSSAGAGSSASRDSLRERLARMRVDHGEASVGVPARGDAEGLAADLGAERVAPGVLRLDYGCREGDRHGRAVLPGPEQRIGFPGMPDLPLGRVGFLDTETSGLAGGTGTVAFNVGLLRRGGDQWQARQYLLTGFKGEAAMLAALADDVSDLSALVSYNGGSFDLPLLRDRYRLNGIATAPFPAQHLDLLHPTRRLFGRRWPDCRLATAEASLLGLQRRGDIPGSAVPGVWFDWLHRGQGGQLADVLRHNRMDIVSLLALLPRLGDAAREPWNWGADSRGAAAAWYRIGDEEHALACLEMGADLDTAGRHELARLLRRSGRRQEAVAVWHQLAAEGDARATEQLAKFYEHVQRDPVAARQWTDRLPAGAAKQRRLDRLRRRAAGTDGSTLSLDFGQGL